MSDDDALNEDVLTANDADATEATFSMQPLDHTLPASEVLLDHHEAAATSQAGAAFVP